MPWLGSRFIFVRPIVHNVAVKFIKTGNSALGVKALTARLQKELAAKKRVLWLICGGSGIAAEAQILKNIRQDKNITNLAILLMDERFGPDGHKDSNWQQLLTAGGGMEGLFALPVLRNLPLEDTVKNYGKLIKVALEAADIVVGQFGLGADGHTAGMLPGTPAAKKTAPLVIAYDSPPFVRVTLTYRALKQVDAAYVFAFGKEKHGALLDLKTNKKPFVKMPSKLFWELPETSVYNDQIGNNP